jgi:hypothetical protein
VLLTADIFLAFRSPDHPITAITRSLTFRSPDHGDHPINLAGPLGFEPRQSAPKALDLPLVDGPKIVSRCPDEGVFPMSRSILSDHPITAITGSPDPKGYPPPSGSTRKTKHLHNKPRDSYSNQARITLNRDAKLALPITTINRSPDLFRSPLACPKHFFPIF